MNTQIREQFERYARFFVDVERSASDWTINEELNLITRLNGMIENLRLILQVLGTQLEAFRWLRVLAIPLLHASTKATNN